MVHSHISITGQVPSLSTPALQANHSVFASVSPILNWAHKQEQGDTTLPQQDLPPDDPCRIIWRRTEEHTKKQICIPILARPSSPCLWYYSQQGSQQETSWSRNHLVSLPKVIRLKIWKYVLVDPSVPQRLVIMDRKASSRLVDPPKSSYDLLDPDYRHPRSYTPELKLYLADQSHSASMSIILTSMAIYQETLPILYEHTTFMPSDIHGLLPLFFGRLSPFAKSCVRIIRLRIPSSIPSPAARNDRAKTFVNWAITCAQIARQTKTLRCVEIEGSWSGLLDPTYRHKILFPLVKINAQKRFMTRSRDNSLSREHDAAFMLMLVEEAHLLNWSSYLRAQRTRVGAAKGARMRERQDESRWQEEASLSIAALEHDDDLHQVDEEDWERVDLGVHVRVEQTEEELDDYDKIELSRGAPDHGSSSEHEDDWDFIRLRSGNPTPKQGSQSLVSLQETGSWLDTASKLSLYDDVDVVEGMHERTLRRSRTGDE